MIYGREYRKQISQSLAFAIYRTIAIWLIVAACMNYGQAGQAVALGIVAVDICSYGAYRAVAFITTEQTRKDWLDRLTNRVFYKLFFDRLRESGANSIDIDDLFREASRAAVDDIKKAEEESRIAHGLFDRTAWHWAGGMFSFVGLIFWNVLYYGSAMVVGSMLR